MEKTSLNNVLQQQDLMKREYNNYDTQYPEYKRKYFNRLYLEHLWMREVYIDFTKFPIYNFPKIWTKEKGEKIDDM
jgi:hypothetical protein